MAINRLSKGPVLVGNVKADGGPGGVGAPATLAQVATVARTDTSAKNLFKLPLGATLDDVIVFGALSNAGTTATLSVGKTGTNTFYVNALDVKTNGGRYALGSAATVANWGAVGATTLQVVGIYAETGVASSAGGPWTVVFVYHFA